MNAHADANQDVKKGTPGKDPVADCDIHPTPGSYKVLDPYLSKHWREHIATYGAKVRHGFQRGAAYPKAQPVAMRRDAWPESGGLPGSDYDLMREQHLDANNVELGILNPITYSGQGLLNQELSAALATASNEWQIDTFLRRDGRLRGSIVVPYENAEASVAEIDRHADDARFVQVILLSRTAEPLGQRRYWPIYEAAVRANLTIGVHAFGYSGNPVTGAGWPSFYMEEMFGHSPSCQALLVSMIMEGVFERFPTLRLVLIEAGCAWLPSLMWRMDKHWKRLKSETPHLKMLPSEYVSRNVWITTQPIEEPEPRSQLVDAIEWMGWDRLLFASDYPHWDFDDPALAFPVDIPKERRRQFLLENAKSIYRVN